MYLDGRSPDDVADELKATVGVKILYVCHRFPFPPKRGGKIRPFNMIRHLHARHEVTVASLARSAAGGRDGRGHRGALRAITKWRRSATPVQMRAHGRARCRRSTPSSMGYFYSPQLARAIRASCSRASVRPDLRALLVASRSTSSDVDGVPKILDFGDMDSQKWLEYARYKPFPLSLGYWLEGSKLAARGAAPGARGSTSAPRRRARNGRRSSGYRTGAPTDWFPNGVDSRLLRARRTKPTTPTRSLRRPHGLLPEPGMHVRFLRERAAARCRRAGPDAEAADRRRRSVAGGAQARRAARRHRDRVGPRRAAVRPSLGAMVAPLNIARGTQNKILEAMAMGVPVVTSRVAAGGVDAGSGEHFLVADRRRAETPRRSDASSTDRRSAAASPRRDARACCRTTPGPSRCERLDAHHRALHRATSARTPERAAARVRRTTRQQ